MSMTILKQNKHLSFPSGLQMRTWHLVSISECAIASLACIPQITQPPSGSEPCGTACASGGYRAPATQPCQPMGYGRTCLHAAHGQQPGCRCSSPTARSWTSFPVTPALAWGGEASPGTKHRCQHKREETGTHGRHTCQWLRFGRTEASCSPLAWSCSPLASLPTCPCQHTPGTDPGRAPASPGHRPQPCASWSGPFLAMPLCNSPWWQMLLSHTAESRGLEMKATCSQPHHAP